MRSRCASAIFLAAALLPAACEKRDEPLPALRAFFEQIARGETGAAYAGAAFGFQAQQTEQVFTAAVRELGLTELVSLTTESSKTEGRTSETRVEIATKQGKKFPLLVTLTDEGGRWRVFSMKSPRSVETGIIENKFSLVGKGTGFTNPVDQPLPAEPVIREMVLDSLTQFNDAIQAQSFQDFYDNAAQGWQKQLTLGQLTRAFQPFIDKGVNMAAIKDLPAVFDGPPHINTEGLLIVSGYYPTKPYRVQFAIKYLYELPKWRLFGLEVNLYK